MTKKKFDTTDIVPIQNLDKVQSEYIKDLYTDPKYSLEIDPLDKYNMSDEQRNFIYYYIQYRDLETAAKLSEIDMDTATEFIKAQSTQIEITRISMAQKYRQFGTRMLSLDEIGGFLSSLIVDVNVPIADRINTTEKVKVSKILMDLHKLKQESITKPDIIDCDPNIDEKLENLSVNEIEKLLNLQNDEKKTRQHVTRKDELISQIISKNKYSSMSDMDALSKLSEEELINILNKEEVIVNEN